MKYKNRCRKDRKEDHRTYCQQFARISKQLIKQAKLDNYTRVAWFLQGFLLRIREDLYREKSKAMNDLEKLDFKDLMEITLEFSMTTKRLQK